MKRLAQVHDYLARAFGGEEMLRSVEEAMQQLVAADHAGASDYDLYVKFRPQVAEGRRGWGQKAALDLDAIREMAGEGPG
jgi:hypothetical protein